MSPEKSKLWIAACEEYSRTGIVSDTLLPGFNQRGEWINLWEGPATAGNPEGNAQIAGRVLDRHILNPDRLIQTDDAGRKFLLGSYVFADPIDPDNHLRTMDFHGVAGRVKCEGGPFRMPNLETIGHGLKADGDASFELPKLKTIDGDLYARNATAPIDVPHLRHIGGDLIVPATTAVLLPNLEAVREIRARKAKRLDLSKLRQAEKMFVEEAKYVNLPELCKATAIYNDHGQTVVLPRLEIIEETLRLFAANTILAPRLKQVGTSLVTPGARDFYKPELTPVHFQPHPDALARWQRKHAAGLAAKNAQTHQPDLEI